MDEKKLIQDKQNKIDSLESGSPKKALIISNGSIADYKKTAEDLLNYFNFKSNFLIICADGAVKKSIALKLIPDVLIGDMDSISKKDLKIILAQNTDITILKSDSQKDESDTQLAIDYAVLKKINKIVIIGAMGGRIDHSLANIFNIASLNCAKTEISILDGCYEIFVLRKSQVIKGRKGDTISIFSLTPDTFFKKTKGLKYSLKNEKLDFSPVRGLSNEFTGSEAEIVFENGMLLIVKQFRI